jgi:phage terminase small subunit
MDSATYPAPAAAGPESPPAAPAAPPRPLTLRQERFCQAYVLVPNAARAARLAGYSRASAKKQGWRLLRARRVRARLADIQAGLARDHGFDLETLIGKLEIVYRQAVEDRRSAAAARAVELQAKLAGIGGRAAAPAPPMDEEDRRYTDEELRAMVAGVTERMRRIGRPAPEDDDAWLRFDDETPARKSA